MTPAIRNSTVVRTLSFTWTHSVVGRVVRAVVTPLATTWRNVGRADASVQRDIGPQPVSLPLQRAAEHSFMISAPERFAARVQRAIATARIVRWARGLADDQKSLPRVTAVRAVGLCMAVAALTHFAALTVIPERLRPALPPYIGVFVVGIALLMMVGSEIVAKAWSARSRR